MYKGVTMKVLKDIKRSIIVAFNGLQKKVVSTRKTDKLTSHELNGIPVSEKTRIWAMEYLNRTGYKKRLIPLPKGWLENIFPKGDDGKDSDNKLLLMFLAALTSIMASRKPTGLNSQKLIKIGRMFLEPGSKNGSQQGILERFWSMPEHDPNDRHTALEHSLYDLQGELILCLEQKSSRKKGSLRVAKEVRWETAGFT